MKVKIVSLLIKVYLILAFMFASLAVFSFSVEWAKPVLWIAVSNLILAIAMAVMNSMKLDSMKEKKNEN